MVSNVEFDSQIGYYINLHELREIFPHIEKDKEVELYLVETRDEWGRLIRRFKPFEKLCLKTGEYYHSYYGWEKCLCLPEDIITRFNIGKSYKVTIILLKYDSKPFLPLETKPIGYDAQKVLEYISKIEANLLLLNLADQPILNKSFSYLWDAYSRLEENNVEGARTALRNSLEVLKKELLPKLTVPEKSEESKTFLNKLEKLVASLQDFLHYGGPHPGPAPRTTTEMILSLSIELIKYLARSIETKVISFQEMKPNVS